MVVPHFILRLFLILAFCSLSPLQGNDLNEYQKLQAEAELKNTPLMIVFLGSDWCPWSKKISDEILSQQEFRKKIGQQFLFLSIEYSEQNPLVEQFHIKELPTLVLLSPLGEEIARFGYLPFSPSDYADRLQHSFTAYQKISMMPLAQMGVEGLKEAYVIAQVHHLQKFQKEILDLGLQKEGNHYFKMIQYEQMAAREPKKARQLKKEILKKDPKNQQGSHRELAVIEFRRLAESEASLAKVVQPLKKYLKEFGSKDKEYAWRLRMVLAQYYFGRGKIADAIKHANRALKESPKQQRQEIMETIDSYKELKA